MIDPHDKPDIEKLLTTSPLIPPMISNGGSTVSSTGFTGQNTVSYPVDVRFNVKVHDDGSGILDSNGYYKVIKWDQWFGNLTNQIIFNLRLNSADSDMVDGDKVFVEAYSTVTGSPTPADDGYLLCKPLLEVAEEYKTCPITFVSDVCLHLDEMGAIDGLNIFKTTQHVVIANNRSCTPDTVCAAAIECDCPDVVCPCVCSTDQYPLYFDADFTGFIEGTWCFPPCDVCDSFNLGAVTLTNTGGCSWQTNVGIGATLTISGTDALLTFGAGEPCATDIQYQAHDVTDCCSPITVNVVDDTACSPAPDPCPSPASMNITVDISGFINGESDTGCCTDSGFEVYNGSWPLTHSEAVQEFCACNYDPYIVFQCEGCTYQLSAGFDGMNWYVELSGCGAGGDLIYTSGSFDPCDPTPQTFNAPGTGGGDCFSVIPNTISVTPAGDCVPGFIPPSFVLTPTCVPCVPPMMMTTKEVKKTVKLVKTQPRNIVPAKICKPCGKKGLRKTK